MQGQSLFYFVGILLFVTSGILLTISQVAKFLKTDI